MGKRVEGYEGLYSSEREAAEYGKNTRLEDELGERKTPEG